MPTDLLPVIANLGVAGFAIWVMYKMHILSSERFEQKDASYAAQVEKHQATMHRHEEYVKQIQAETMISLRQATDVIKENTHALNNAIAFFQNRSKP